MADIPNPEHVNLATHLEKVATAAEAVREGIATHAQKHEADRTARRERMAAEAKVTAGQVSHA